MDSAITRHAASKRRVSGYECHALCMDCIGNFLAYIWIIKICSYGQVSADDVLFDAVFEILKVIVWPARTTDKCNIVWIDVFIIRLLIRCLAAVLIAVFVCFLCDVSSITTLWFGVVSGSASTSSVGSSEEWTIPWRAVLRGVLRFSACLALMDVRMVGSEMRSYHIERLVSAFAYRFAKFEIGICDLGTDQQIIGQQNL
jgi:hypothetical protein